jgi:S-(hydroxymethyl)glutathione dehydrogenase / alcohol dehydrogenase
VRAAILEEFGKPLVVEEVELLPPGPSHVIVRTTASVFCITDCINQRGDLGKQLPTILGHAGVGVVEELGRDVDGVEVGARVIVPGTPECGHCYWCVRGRPDQCADLFVPQPHVANRANGEAVTSSGGGGTYAEQMRVPKSWIFPVETELPDDRLSLLGCGITTGLGAVFNAAAVEPGSSVAVIGCGHLGLWMIQGARVAGAAQVIAVEPHAERRALAGQLGATDLVDPADGDPVEQVRALTEGRGADYALDAAGPPGAQEQAVLMTRRAGTVVLTGLESLAATVTLSQVEIGLRGRDVRSCQNGRVRMRRDIPRFVRMLEDSVVDARPIITAHYPLEQINDALQASGAREDLSGVILMDGLAQRPGAS